MTLNTQYRSDWGSGDIQRAPLNCSGQVTPVVPPRTFTYPTRLRLAGDDLYVQDGPLHSLSKSIKQVSKNGGEVATLVDEAQFMGVGFALDGSHIYWSVLDPGMIKKVPMEGGAVTILASGLRAPNSLAVDERFVYWAEQAGGEVGAGSIQAVSLDGGSVQVLASGLTLPWNDLALDATHVYFTEPGTSPENATGVLRRVEKPNTVSSTPAWRVSVKFILDSDGRRPTESPNLWGNLNTDDEVVKQVDRANGVLCKTGRGSSLMLTEILDIHDASRWFEFSINDTSTLENEVKSNPSKFGYRTDAINIYVVKDVPEARGLCYCPGNGFYRDIIVLDQEVSDVTLLHEVGHYFGLHHTQGKECNSCDPTQAGLCHTIPGDDDVADTLPDLACWFREEISQYSFSARYIDLPESWKLQVDDTYENVMSYHVDRSILTQGQMDRWLDQAFRIRSEVAFVRQGFVCPPPCPNPNCEGEAILFFLRGDPDQSGQVDLTDAVRILGVLFLGDKSLACQDPADINDDGQVDITDPIALLSYLFLGGRALPLPGPQRCGPDGQGDEFPECHDFRGCVIPD